MDLNHRLPTVARAGTLSLSYFVILASRTGLEPALSKVKAWCPNPNLDERDIV